MKLKKLTVCNFCQHEYAEFDFSLGLSGILGPNGSGKSNLIQGIIYAITGTVKDNLNDYIRTGSGDANSYVSLIFESDSSGQTYEITRSLRPRRAKLKTPTETLTGAKPIDAYLVDTLGIDFNVVKNILTVSQEDFVAFFRLTDSDRALLLQRLFGFTVLKTGREDLRKLLVSSQVTDETDGSIKAFESLLEQDRKDIKEFSRTPETAELRRNKEVVEARKLEAQEDIGRFGAIKALEQHRLQLLQRLERAEAILGDTVVPETVAPLEVQMQETEREYAEVSRRLQESRDRGPQLDAFKQTIQEYQSAVTAINALPFPDPEEQREALVQRLAVLRSNRDKLALCLDTGVCPTCGKPYDNVKEDYAAVCKEFDDLSELSKIDLTKRRNYTAAKQVADAKYRAFELAANRLYPTVPNGFKPEDPLDTVFASYERELSQMTTLWQKVSDGRQALSVRIAEAKEAQRKFGALQMECDVIKKELAAAANSPAPVPLVFKSEADAQKALAAFDANLKELDVVWQKALSRDTIQLHIFDLEARLKVLQAQKSKDLERQQYRMMLEEAYDILAPEAFPKQVLIGLLKILSTNINNYLLLFNAPFTVLIDANSTELMCDFGDDTPMAAARLSGGQKVLLAVSWRLALHNTFATEESCGFLTLDEPTTFLDTNNIENLTSVLQQVRKTALDANLQILVITHEKSLEPLFDNVINLS